MFQWKVAWWLIFNCYFLCLGDIYWTKPVQTQCKQQKKKQVITQFTIYLSRREHSNKLCPTSSFILEVLHSIPVFSIEFQCSPFLVKLITSEKVLSHTQMWCAPFIWLQSFHNCSETSQRLIYLLAPFARSSNLTGWLLIHRYSRKYMQEHTTYI